MGWHGAVRVDAGFHAHLNTAEDYEKTVGETTWKAVNYFAQQLRGRKVKIGFFSATPEACSHSLLKVAWRRLNMVWYVSECRNVPGQFSEKSC